MGWASTHIERLRNGETVKFRPKGNSMQPKIKSGDLCTVVPYGDIQVGNIVLCKVNGHQYLHLVTAMSHGQYQISNNKGHVNGWISRKAIYGILLSVER
jgi:phage repressor protein C with HTH and peptisase S24 domain